MLGHLLRFRLRRWHNPLARRRRSRLRAAAVALLAVALLAGVTAASWWFFERCLELEPIGLLIVRRSLGMVLLVVFSLLAFSSLVASFGTFFLADDLPELVTRPVPPETLFSARFVDTALAAGWMVVPASLPILLVAGRVLDAGDGYRSAVAVVTGSLLVLATSCGIIAALLVTSVLSARSARHVMVLAGSALLGALLLLLRSLRPEQLLRGDDQAPLLEALAALQGLEPAWLPTAWALDALWTHLGPGARLGTHPLTLLASAAAASFFAAGWLHRALYPRAFSRAQEGLHHRGQTSGQRRPLETLVALARHGRERLRPQPAIRRKDRRELVRDTAQWSQGLVLVAIVALYVLNFRYIQAVSGSGLAPVVVLHFLNLALAGFVALAITARFAFPAISLEGRALWLIRSSPVTARELVEAKARSWRAPLAAFAAGLTAVTEVFLRAEPLLVAIAAVVAGWLAWCLVSLAVGLGARFPRFDLANPVEVATGLGGLTFMLVGALLLVVVVLASVPGTLALLAVVTRGRTLPVSWLATAVAGLAVVAAAPAVAGRAALAAGARFLDEGEPDES